MYIKYKSQSKKRSKKKSKIVIPIRPVKNIGFLTGPNITGGSLPIIAKSTKKSSKTYYFVKDGNIVKFINSKTLKGYSFYAKQMPKLDFILSNYKIESHPANYYILKLNSPAPKINKITPAFSPGVTPAFSPCVTPAFSPGVTPAFSPGVTPAFSPGVNKVITPAVVPVVLPRITPAFSPGVNKVIIPAVVPRIVLPDVTPTYGPSTYINPMPSIISYPVPSFNNNIYIYIGISVFIFILIIFIIIYYNYLN